MQICWTGREYSTGITFRRDTQMDLSEARRPIFTQRKTLRRLSHTRRQSLSSVEIKSVAIEKVRRCIEEYAAELLARNATVEEIIVFGSFANDTYAPGSDMDVFIILSRADEPVH